MVLDMTLSDYEILNFLRRCDGSELTIKQIQAGLNIYLSRSTIKRAVKRLHDSGSIKIVSRRGSHYGNVYHVHS